MKKFLQKIDEWIGTHIILDDMLHLEAGGIIAAVLYVILLLCLSSVLSFHSISFIVFILTFVGGLAKEIVDKFVKHTEFGIRDLIATTCGGISMILYMEILKLFNIIN